MSLLEVWDGAVQWPNSALARRSCRDRAPSRGSSTAAKRPHRGSWIAADVDDLQPHTCSGAARSQARIRVRYGEPQRDPARASERGPAALQVENRADGELVSALDGAAIPYARHANARDQAEDKSDRDGSAPQAHHALKAHWSSDPVAVACPERLVSFVEGGRVHGAAPPPSWITVVGAARTIALVSPGEIERGGNTVFPGGRHAVPTASGARVHRGGAWRTTPGLAERPAVLFAGRAEPGRQRAGGELQIGPPTSASSDVWPR